MSHVITTPMLLDMARTADARRLNRRADVARLERDLDPEGFHVIAFTMLHNESEMRCEVLAKVKESDAPHRIWLDVPLDRRRNVMHDVGWDDVVQHADGVHKVLVANGIVEE